MNLSNLVIIAYRVDSNRLVAPDWMTRPSPWFNLSATVPSNTTKEQFELMLQNLLSDRFKLSVHHENREIAQFDLVVARSGRKFKEAADSVPAADGAGDGGSSTPQRPTMDKNGFPVLQPGRAGMATSKGKARLYQPRTTMQALAAQLAGPLHRPVTDATGLAGQYEINLYWVLDSGLRTAAAPDAAAQPADTDTGPTLTQALDDQLGLRLETKKGQVDFLVVDHAEKTPLEN
jgi:uncharacterized protein (TIGR03435 family)